MRQYSHLFLDERLLGFCAFCGLEPDTRDHVPPKAFLDKPYPANLAQVGACFDCNNSASLDEEYVACLLEACVCNTVDPAHLQREKIAATFRKQPSLAERIGAMLTPGGLLLTDADITRLERVVSKIGRGLWTFETGEPTNAVNVAVAWSALPNLSAEDTARFMQPPVGQLLPELGSRMFLRHFSDDEDAFDWTMVQEKRFSYLVDTAGRVRVLLRDYLAAEITLEWND
ncbi:hypothetical protein JIG36_33395 [Actinoplanes sp. LDG1-06]|uniref:HNH endonuclease n=1 Tax=Paractinoplanes ovalisporus TaxID=2810368 RepID=A0ABS2AKX5_9ACTN|nr:hypothetical protein [Actinoplanes ovalisporus]MBM2620418.1 hypothetical protein [Actinoplanes ovalisporus]